MRTLTIRNLPEAVYEQLRHQAVRNKCTLNDELLRCLKSAVEIHPRNRAEFLETVVRERESLSVPPLTDEFLEQAIATGRTLDDRLA